MPTLGRAYRTRQPIFLSHHKNIGAVFQATLWL
jgi:sensor histidine kinase regulating citrate/malate metabolism